MVDRRESLNRTRIKSGRWVARFLIYPTKGMELENNESGLETCLILDSTDLEVTTSERPKLNKLTSGKGSGT